MNIEFPRMTEKERLNGCVWRSDLVAAWFRSHYIYIGKYRKDFDFDYNSAYHFYDLYLFERTDLKPGHEAAHINAAIRLLKKNGHRIKLIDRAIRWAESEEGRRQINGVRIWIVAEKPRFVTLHEGVCLDTLTGELFEDTSDTSLGIFLEA